MEISQISGAVSITAPAASKAAITVCESRWARRAPNLPLPAPGGAIVHDGRIATLRRVQDDVREVQQGFECGLTIEGYNDVREGDVIEAFDMETIAPTLENPTGK